MQRTFRRDFGLILVAGGCAFYAVAGSLTGHVSGPVLLDMLRWLATFLLLLHIAANTHDPGGDHPLGRG